MNVTIFGGRLTQMSMENTTVPQIHKSHLVKLPASPEAMIRGKACEFADSLAFPI
jgi:hypothetical protein